ncbi:MAG: GTP-binding protein [Porticoccaceae bacterium]|nr:MAG: GTP-binding protein [Porticoccaceae bacterium]
MAVHLDEEQQFEALKNWWRRHGSAVILAAAVLVAGIGGWYYWQERQRERAEQASIQFLALLEALEGEEADRKAPAAELVTTRAEAILGTGAGGFYPALARLALARLAVSEGDLTAAAEQLRAVVEEGPEDLLPLARLRLAAVEGAQGLFAEALGRLAESYPESYRPLVLELKGDLLDAQGDREGAVAAWRDALAIAGGRHWPLLEMKIAALAPGDAAQAKEEG